MRDAPTVPEAEWRRQLIVKRYQRDFPEACRYLLDEAEASLIHLYIPQRPQQYVRTSNLAERAFEEERRRTKGIPHLWDEGSVTKLVFAVLIRVSERWGKKCFSPFEQHQIHSLRERLKLDEQEGSTDRTLNSPTIPPKRCVCCLICVQELGDLTEDQSPGTVQAGRRAANGNPHGPESQRPLASVPDAGDPDGHDHSVALGDARAHFDSRLVGLSSLSDLNRRVRPRRLGGGGTGEGDLPGYPIRRSLSPSQATLRRDPFLGLRHFHVGEHQLLKFRIL
jgi:Transposase, Mutator family